MLQNHLFAFPRNAKRRGLCLALAALFLLLSCSSCADTVTPDSNAPVSEEVQQGDLLLAEGGGSAYRVIVSAEASEDTVKIAEEFVQYFSALTGVTLSVERDTAPEAEREILIGKTNRTRDDFDYSSNVEDTFCCKTVGRSLLLTGVGARGVAYAVYAFLEEVCGVRYYTPEYEFVPSHDTLSVPQTLNLVSSPVFTLRDLDGAGSSDPKWMVKMRLNGLQSLGSERYQKKPFVGGGVGYAGWWVHTIAQLAEMESPEGGFWDVQPCLMDEAVYQTVVKNVRAWLDEHPQASLVSISQNDGDKNSMCQCEKCRAFVEEHGGAESALWIYFVSRVATELGDEYPHVDFDTLSYTFTSEAPTGLVIPENVVVRVAPLRACFRHGLFSCTQEDEATERLRTSLLAWSELLSENFHVWEYDAFFSEYWSPNVNFSRLRENLKTYASLGVTGVFVQGDGSGSGGFSELRAYLAAKLLWDPQMEDETFEGHLSDFLEGYYGKGTAAPLMRYMELVDEKTETSHYTVYSHAAEDYLPVDAYDDSYGNKRMDKTFLKELSACFDEAEAQGQSEEQRLHLEKARIQVRYYELVCYHFMDSNFGSKEHVLARNELGAALYADAKRLGIQQLMEGYWLSKTTTETWRHPLMWYKEYW